MALSAIIPFLPLVTKLIDKKKKSEKYLEGTTGVTEVAQGGYLLALGAIANNLAACGTELTLQSVTCISAESWGLLMVAISYSVARLNAKKKEGENNE